MARADLYMQMAMSTTAIGYLIKLTDTGFTVTMTVLYTKANGYKISSTVKATKHGQMVPITKVAMQMA